MEVWLALVALAIVILAVVGLMQIKSWLSKSNAPNPFEKDCRKTRKPYIHDQKERDKVLKQGFAQSKLPENVDAIVIGSGIGGLTTAAILAKAGRKVLVLEQHDQAGGLLLLLSSLLLLL